MTHTPSPEVHFLHDGGWCPNNADLPLLIYRRAAADGESGALASYFEGLFARHGWPPAWRYTIYDYPHFHSTAHEVIGIYRGNAEVRFGDEAGFTTLLCRGDVVIIPAGVSHERISSSGDFHGVGAYPEGCRVDEQTRNSEELAAARARVAQVPVPVMDPVLGVNGFVQKMWMPHIARN